uniref:E3 ubiquitin protein ligase DRIP2-like n=1 Tax=Rhizophora mucronata TaxID=61149 RepID=A0A2P2KMI9_RHIMU
MAETVVKVKRETLEACMTCPLCNKLLRDATTISLCLHTFCRKCIYEKLSDEEVDCCPVCNIDLGCLPVEKLRFNFLSVTSKPHRCTCTCMLTRRYDFGSKLACTLLSS